MTQGFTHELTIPLPLNQGGTGAVLTQSVITKINVQTFTASGTYTPSSGMVYCIAKAQAGGAGGGTATVSGSTTVGAGGGSSGSYGEGLYTAAQIGASQAVTIGAGGATDSPGGATTLGALLVTIGGNAGGATGNVSHNVGGQEATPGTGGYLNLPGNPGGPGFSATAPATISGDVAIGGTGANSPLGGGGGVSGHTSSGGNAGGAAVGYGGGGGGAYTGGTGSAAGGAGAAGFMEIIEFISI